MEIKVILLSKSKYNFNDDNGEIIAGANVFYLIDNGLEPLKLSINKFNNNLELQEKISVLPGYYNLELGMSVSKGKMVQVVKDIKFIKELDLFKGI